MERWASVSSRRATARENRARSRAHSAELERNDVKIRLSPENAEWLRQERVFRKATSADIINGLLNVARLSK